MKKINFLLDIYSVTSIILLTAFLTYSQQKTKYQNLSEALNATHILRGNETPESLNWINNGMEYSYTLESEIRAFDPGSLKDKLVLDSKKLNYPNSDSVFNYKSFQWANDSKHILFQSNFRKIYRRSGISDYFIYSLQDKSLKLAVKNARTAQLSPNGTMVGYEKDGNLFVFNFIDQKELQLTDDARGKIFNGHYDWVYEEEFGQAQAWEWSPNNKYIAYWQFDETGVPEVLLTDFAGLHPTYEKIPIPQVGDQNPKVRIGVIDVLNNKKIWLIPDVKGDYYIPRIYWTNEPNTLAMLVLNRAQTDLKLFFFNVISGNQKLIMEEKSNTWISIFNFYTNVGDKMYFPKNLNEFFWISDRNNWNQIFRYDYNGNLLNKVTTGNYDVIKIVGINPDSQTIYYTSTEATPLEEQLYSIKFDGTNQKRLTLTAGYHQISMSPNTKFYIDTYSNTITPIQVELWNIKGKMLKKIEDNKDVINFIYKHEYSYKQLFSFKTSDGLKLDCSMIKPFNFDSTKKYPVILSIYGGPESQSVYNSFAYNGFDQFLAQQGYIIVDVNNRGNANYGKLFEKIVYKNLGKWESHDFVETANYLTTLPYVDGKNMAIMGTSYGGYSTVYTMLTHPGTFKVGIANSPVTDWRLYDDIYTEAYMGLLKDNESGYIKSSAITYADSLRGRLLLIHSLMDDNVHINNTMQLVTALTNAGKDVSLRIYPPGEHGAIYNPQSNVLVHNAYLQFLNEYLKGKCNQKNINEK